MKIARSGTQVACSQGDDAATTHSRDDVFLTAAQVRRRYGSVSAMTLHRQPSTSALAHLLKEAGIRDSRCTILPPAFSPGITQQVRNRPMNVPMADFFALGLPIG